MKLLHIKAYPDVFAPSQHFSGHCSVPSCLQVLVIYLDSRFPTNFEQNGITLQEFINEAIAWSIRSLIEP